MVLFGQKVADFWEKLLYLSKVVVFRQIGSSGANCFYWGKLVLFWQKDFYLGKI